VSIPCTWKTAAGRARGPPNGPRSVSHFTEDDASVRRLVRFMTSTVPATSSQIPSPPSSAAGDGPPGALQARGLGQTFKGGVEAVRGIGLSVRAGGVFGFRGSDGAGKTSTGRVRC